MHISMYIVILNSRDQPIRLSILRNIHMPIGTFLKVGNRQNNPNFYYGQEVYTYYVYSIIIQIRPINQTSNP